MEGWVIRERPFPKWLKKKQWKCGCGDDCTFSVGCPVCIIRLCWHCWDRETIDHHECVRRMDELAK